MAKMKIKSEQKIIIIIILALFFLAGIGISLWYKNQQTGGNLSQDKYSKGKVLPKTASLTLSTAEKKVAQDQTFTVKLVLDSGDQGVEAADFAINFDPKYLQATSINPGNYFKTYPVKKTEANVVKISGVAYFDGQSIIVPKGRGEVANIEFTAVAQVGKTTLTIDREKTIIASDGQNILSPNKITDLSISIK